VNPIANTGESILFLYSNSHNKARVSKGVEIINPTVPKVDMYIVTAAINSRILITVFFSILAGGFDSEETEKDFTNSVTAKIAEKVIMITKNAAGKVPGPPIAVIGVLNGSRNATLNPAIPRATNAKAT